MHHALMLPPVLGIGCHVDDYWVVFGQASLEVGLLPLELLVLGG